MCVWWCGVGSVVLSVWCCVGSVVLSVWCGIGSVMWCVVYVVCVVQSVVYINLLCWVLVWSVHSVVRCLVYVNVILKFNDEIEYILFTKLGCVVNEVCTY